MKKYHFICIIAVLLAMVTGVQAQEERNKSLINSYLHGWEYGIKAGFNIGGTSPIPLPKEIRKIDSYAPGIAIAIEGNATKWFDKDKKWGLTKYDYRSHRKELRYENHQHQRWRIGRSLDRRCQDQSEKLLSDDSYSGKLPYQQTLDIVRRPLFLLSAGR